MSGRIAYTGNIVTNGLVLNLDAGKVDSYPRSGTVWRDISGNNFSGSLINGPTFSSANAGNIAFDGSNDYVEISNVGIINFTPLNSFTLTVWANITDIPGSQDNRTATVFGRGTTANSFGIGMNVTVASGSQWYVGSRGSADASLTATLFPYTYGTIESITFTYTPTSQSIYKNGSLVATQAVPAGVSGTFFDDLPYVMSFLRAVVGGNSARFAGSVYHASIYNRALSATEVSQNFNALRGRYGI